MQEVWKVWKETYNRRYGHTTWEVSNYSNVKKNGVLFDCRLDKKGYKVFGSNYGVHRAVAKLFIPNPENKPCVDHINGDRLDNRICNLRWCTHKENMNNPITLKRFSESMKGKNTGPKSEETRKRMSEAKKRYWKNKKAQNKNILPT